MYDRETGYRDEAPELEPVCYCDEDTRCDLHQALLVTPLTAEPITWRGLDIPRPWASITSREAICEPCAHGDHELHGQGDCDCACHMTAAKVVPATVPALVGFGAPIARRGVVSVGNGIYIRTGRRA